ncbi:MAG TPA: hypothetical protein V6D48_21840, partial [Oculatellaceae cyanobacterium]
VKVGLKLKLPEGWREIAALVVGCWIKISSSESEIFSIVWFNTGLKVLSKAKAYVERLSVVFMPKITKERAFSPSTMPNFFLKSSCVFC